MNRWCPCAVWLVFFAGACVSEDEDGHTDEASEGDQPETFPCGAGGSCLVESEMCLVDGSNGCTICAPLPAACDPTLSCGCLPPADDPAFGTNGCADAGSCEMVEGGLVITCTEAANWGCG